MQNDKTIITIISFRFLSFISFYRYYRFKLPRNKYPSSNGRLELIHFVREVSISYDYHRYGSLMARENEPRESVQ